jgi:iron complex outermembrane receptor protein
MKSTIPHKLLLLTCTISTLITPVASAQAASKNDSRMVIGTEEVVVIGKQVNLTEVVIPGAVDTIARDQLEYEHVNFTADLFKKVPGVYFSHFNQGIISANIAMRGFDGEGSSPHSKLLIDGIPANLHVGYSEMDALFPLEIAAIEVVKGTNDPRYGLYNTAGNVNIKSRHDLDHNQLEFLAGSFGSYEAQAYVANKSGDFSQHYFIGARKTDGYRDQSGLEKTTFSGKWFYDFSDAIRLGVIARHFNYEADAPGYLSEADAHNKPRSSATFSSSDGGNKTTNHLSAHLDIALADNIDWSLKTYLQHFERQRWVRFTAIAKQQERYEDEKQAGVISTLSWSLAQDWLLNWGVDYEAQDNLHQRFVTSNRERTGVISRNHQFDFNHYGTYIQLQQNLTETFTWIAGVRATEFSGSFINQANGQERDINDYGTLTQPTLSLQYNPSLMLGFFANMGRTYQIGNGIGAYALPGKDVNASRNNGNEIGTKYSPTDNVDLRFSLWQQNASNELAAKADSSGDFENIGKTERKGWELVFNWRPLDDWYAWGSYTDQNATLVEPGLTNVAIKNNTLNHIPEYTAALGVEYQITSALKANLFNRYQGKSYVSNDNSLGQYGQYRITDLSFNYAWNGGDLGLRITNLFNRYSEYVYYDTDIKDTIHSPGDSRGFTLSVSFDL